MIFRNKNGMHFVGIGGVGMSGIAEILLNMGFKVSGSDKNDSDNTRRLSSLGAKIFKGHDSSNIDDEISVLVTSSAIDFDNPEIITAKKKGIPIIHRSEMLAELVRMKHGIGVAGTHGKTTTSSMLSSVLWSCGLNPTSVVGGKVLNFGSNARSGEGEYLVFEADESDGSFLKLLPAISIVTNIDSDHLDHYKYFDGIKEAFLKYINNIPFYGYSVLCIDDTVIREILPQVDRPFYTYGFSDDADFHGKEVRFEDGKMKYSCYFKGNKLGDVELGLLGYHNALNSLSVVAVASELGIDFPCITRGIAEFKGVGRRIEYIGEKDGILVLDDYGHHPTEIKATLNAVKNLGRRTVVLFQPHRYSRTQLLYQDFGKAFSDADLLFLTEVYSAGERPIDGVSSKLISDEYSKNENKECRIFKSPSDAAMEIGSFLKNGDILITLGAGDIYKAGKFFLSGGVS
ncbi:MAG TPA: UDP-N-acetylmuramate--L-alanine ligase [Spirochaetota bacterium]|nr:UDP-N-acetylmuramate--L-alanine ligase [Spirochaetota bacterium]HOH36423.1 UDP-N-acetylmuramate--L-alanine ligase [Spirochaetota bacterium]HPJ14500.1 UDP-N-acetylmuramate--L-alanine ligase [Spirochaetota bacterium]HPY02794.1 UDP-N-acetylmuramate--L-alanine ligase [Spirochaetota bacterium]HQA51570.1 UDP-N-acetylmuramate--L-alanine ligase [Spirochaetota bacterium]